MAERKGNDRRELVIGFPDEFKNDYGEGCREPIITSCMEGPHGYSNIIGKDEVPDGIGIWQLDPSKIRRSQKG